MDILVRRLFVFTLLSITSFQLQASSAGAVVTGFVVDSAMESADQLIRTAFDRLDLSLLQAGMEARATIKEAESSLKNVLDHTFDKLDQQQRELVTQLMQFERLVAQDAEKVLLEVREEKNAVF